MPSFDVVSELDMHEVTNAVDQASREVSNRFDFKGTNCKFEQDQNIVKVIAESDFQLKQLIDILEGKLIKRGIDTLCLDKGAPEVNLSEARQNVTLREGLESQHTKKIVKLIKDQKFKVQPSIQGDKVRVTGKKRDDLQTVMSYLKEAGLEMPLQFNNFRD